MFTDTIPALAFTHTYTHTLMAVALVITPSNIHLQRFEFDGCLGVELDELDARI